MTVHTLQMHGVLPSEELVESLLDCNEVIEFEFVMEDLNLKAEE